MRRLLTVGRTLADAEHRMQDRRIDPREARTLLAFVLKKDESQLIAHPSAPLPYRTAGKFRLLLARRLRGVPFAYLTGRKWFYGLEFRVSPSVLIPRPETEGIVDWIRKTSPADRVLTILDVGTGSGCIAVTLAKYFPKATIIASDASTGALAVARANARLHGVSKRIIFRHGDLLGVLKPNERIDLVIANLPYLTPTEAKKLPREPKLALLGGERSDDLVIKLLGQINTCQIPYAILEIAPRQVKKLTSLRTLAKNQCKMMFDLAGKTRFVTIKNPAPETDAGQIEGR